MAKGKTTKATPKAKARAGAAKAVKSDAAFGDGELPPVEGSEAARNKYLPLAEALPAAEIKPFRGDPSIVYHNVADGLDAVLGRSAEVEKELPAVKLSRLRELVAIALGLAFAARQVDRKAGSPGTIAELRSKAAGIREILLQSALALKASGIVPAREVERIEEGKGSLDQAQDCIDLAALFRKHAKAVRGKTAVTAAQITEAAKIGTELVQLLKPRGAKRSVAPVTQAERERDQLATLLRQRHAELVKTAGYLFGYEASKLVPPLGSRVVVRKAVKKSGSAAQKKPTQPTASEATAS